MRAEDGTEPSQTESLPSQTPTSMTSSKIEKVSVLRTQLDDGDTIKAPSNEKATKATGAAEDALRYNSILRHKRKVSLSQMPEENKRGLAEEVSFTPNAKSKSPPAHLFVSDGKPQRDPPLTSKQNQQVQQTAFKL